jgi:hypothetical protein
MFYTPHTMIYVIYTELKLMKFEECTYEFRGQIGVSNGRNTNGSWFGNYPCGTRIVGGFLQCWTLDVWGNGTSFYMPHPYL